MEFYGIEERKTGIRWIQSHQLQYISAEQPYAEASVGIYTGRTNDGYGLGLYWTDFSATAPEVETFTVDIPGRNGLLDYSEALTGSPVYKNATLSATFVAQALSKRPARVARASLYHCCRQQFQLCLSWTLHRRFHHGRCQACCFHHFRRYRAVLL